MMGEEQHTIGTLIDIRIMLYMNSKATNLAVKK